MILQKLDKITSKLSFQTFLEVWSDLLNQNKQFIEDAQRYQLGRGELPNGEDTDDYSDVSIDLFDKPTTDNPYLEDPNSAKITGYDEGDLYRDIYADINPFGITHDTSNEKKSLLEERIGKFLGINKETAKIILEEFRVAYIARLRAETLP